MLTIDVLTAVKSPLDHSHKHALACYDQEALVGQTKRPYIRALQCAMRSCLQKATAMRPDAIFFLFTVTPNPEAMAAFSPGSLLV